MRVGRNVETQNLADQNALAKVYYKYIVRNMKNLNGFISMIYVILIYVG